MFYAQKALPTNFCHKIKPFDCLSRPGSGLFALNSELCRHYFRLLIGQSLNKGLQGSGNKKTCLFNMVRFSKKYKCWKRWGVMVQQLWHRLRCQGTWVYDPVGSILFLRKEKQLMSRKGPEVGKGMLDFVDDIFVGVKSH